MNMGFSLRILSVILTVLIALVPLWYPRHSFFVRNASKGIEELQSRQNKATINGTERRIGALGPPDIGYREIARTIREQTDIGREPTKILLVEEVENTTKLYFGNEIHQEHQAALMVEFEGGDVETVIEPPAFDTHRVLELKELKRWVKNQANKRSHYWTTVLAVSWGTVSLFTLR